MEISSSNNFMQISSPYNVRRHYSDLDKSKKRCPGYDKLRKYYSDDGIQTHVHEFLGSTRLPGERVEPHNHRVAGVTGEAIPLQCGNHKHRLCTNTDFYEGHYHELAAETGPAISVGKGRHVHFVKALTTVDADHFHEIIFATLIEDPTGD